MSKFSTGRISTNNNNSNDTAQQATTAPNEEEGMVTKTFMKNIHTKRMRINVKFRLEIYLPLVVVNQNLTHHQFVLTNYAKR